MKVIFNINIFVMIFILTLILFLLKIMNVIHLPWFWVFSPIWVVGSLLWTIILGMAMFCIFLNISLWD